MRRTLIVILILAVGAPPLLAQPAGESAQKTSASGGMRPGYKWGSLAFMGLGGLVMINAGSKC